jgi:NAD(P)-dependent dehydrogenase (short-subunit alcohol dehydrogenase family)
VEDAVAVARAECAVPDESAVGTLFDRVRPADLLVNRVSVAGNPPLERTSLEEWRAQLDVNATGAFLCACCAVRDAQARQRPDRHGRIDGGVADAKYMAAFSAPKHAAV